MSESTWFTTLPDIRANDPSWEAVAAYHRPIARFLARAFPHLDTTTRDDVAQDVICAMKASVVARFDPDAGRFRDYLRGVVRNHVRAALRARAPTTPLPDLPDPHSALHDSHLAALDLEAQLLQAVRAWHDALAQGSDRDRQTLYCFAARIFDRASYTEIAAREHLSHDAVKRRLQHARHQLLHHLLLRALTEADLPPLRPRTTARLARALQHALTRHQPLSPPWGLAKHPRTLRAAEHLLDTIRAAAPALPGLTAPDGQAFLDSLRTILLDP